MEYTFTLKRDNRKEAVIKIPKKPKFHWIALNLGLWSHLLRLGVLCPCTLRWMLVLLGGVPLVQVHVFILWHLIISIRMHYVLFSLIYSSVVELSNISK
jgi:hypothetical protein